MLGDCYPSSRGRVEGIRGNVVEVLFSWSGVIRGHAVEVFVFVVGWSFEDMLSMLFFVGGGHFDGMSSRVFVFVVGCHSRKCCRGLLGGRGCGLADLLIVLQVGCMSGGHQETQIENMISSSMVLGKLRRNGGGR